MQIGVTLGQTWQPAGPKNGDTKKTEAAAKQFEAILLNELLKSAHAADEDDDSQTTAVSDYSQQQFAQTLAERGGLGIAKIVLAGLEKHAH